MHELIFVKTTQGVPFDVAHVYEHAFIDLINDRLRQQGYNPSLIANINAETFSTTFLYISLTVSEPNAVIILKSLFAENPLPSISDWHNALRQTASEDVSTTKIIAVSRYKEMQLLIAHRTWSEMSQLPIVTENLPPSATIIYTERKDLYSIVRITLCFENLSTQNTAVLNRLTYLISNVISHGTTARLHGYLLSADLLHASDGFGFIELKMVIKRTISRTVVREHIMKDISIITNCKNFDSIRQNFAAWTNQNYTQSASINYYRQTGILVGSNRVLAMLESCNIESLFSTFTIDISIRKLK